MIDDDYDLKELERRVAGYSYRVDNSGTYGLDSHSDEYEVDEGEMSLVLPFADGQRRDGVGDLLEISGIDVSRHRGNPISLFDHGKAVTLPIGLFSDPNTNEYTVQLDPIAKTAKGKVFIYQGSGIPNAKKEQEYPHAVFCQQIFDLWVKKFIRAGSIGYQVIDGRQLQPDYERGTQAGLHLIRILMLEGSVVVMPANQDTVRKSYSEAAREILAMPLVCGKSLSPFLVKSLQPYVQNYNKTVVSMVKTGCMNCNAPLAGITHNVFGKELCSGCYVKGLESSIKAIPTERNAEIETAKVPLNEDLTKTDIPPVDWKPGLGAKKDLEKEDEKCGKDLCPNNSKITLSDDYGCPSAFESQRKGLRSCKSCGKSLQSVQYLVKELPEEEIDSYEKALVGSLKKGLGIIYRSKAAIVDDIGDVEDGKIKVMLTDGRKFVADPNDYVKKFSDVKKEKGEAKFEIGDTVEIANGKGEGQIINRVMGANGWAYVVHLFPSGRTYHAQEVEMNAKSLDLDALDESDDDVQQTNQTDEKDVDFWGDIPKGKSMKSIRSKYKFMRNSKKKKSMGDIGEKLMRPDEVIAGGFPQFVTDADDRYKLESAAPSELRTWREAVAKHNSLASTSAKLRHRRELEDAFRDLKRAYDKMKREKSFKSIRSKYKGFPGEIRSYAENVAVGDKLSIFSSQHIVRKVRRNSEDPSQIEFELDNGEMVYRRTGDPVYMTMRGKSIKGWKAWSSQSDISDAMWRAEQADWDKLSEAEKTRIKKEKKEALDKEMKKQEEEKERKRKAKEKEEKDRLKEIEKKFKETVKKDKSTAESMKSEATRMLDKFKRDYPVFDGYSVEVVNVTDMGDDYSAYQTWGLYIVLEFNDWVNNKKVMKMTFKASEDRRLHDDLNYIENSLRTYAQKTKSMNGWKSVGIKAKGEWESDFSFNDVYGKPKQTKETEIKYLLWSNVASSYIDDNGEYCWSSIKKAAKFDSRSDAESFKSKFPMGKSWIVKTKNVPKSKSINGWKSLKVPSKSKALCNIRHKYRTTKGLVRRLRKSASGSSMIYVRSKDLDELEKEAIGKDLTINRMGSHSKGIEKVKLSGNDGSIDALAKKFGRSSKWKSLNRKAKSVNYEIVSAFRKAGKWSMDKLEGIIEQLRNMNPADVLHTWEAMGFPANNRWTANELKRHIANTIRKEHNLQTMGYAYGSLKKLKKGVKYHG